VDPRRLSAGERVAAGSGLLLLVSLFLPWYTSSGHHVDAWQAMSVDDVIFAFAGLAALLAAAATAARPSGPVPIVYTVLAAFPGSVAAVLAVWRLVDPAPPVDVGLGIGAWLGLAGALGIAVGTWTGMHDDGPERRGESAARASGEAWRARSELLTLPPDTGQGGAGERGA
jgi:hypothetical protein